MNDLKSRIFFSLLLMISFLLVSCGNAGEDIMQRDEDPLSYVDPFIGTGFHGHTFPGPVMPNGMVQPGPDTKLNGWDASSGYHSEDSTIYGFSQTHLSGTGIGDMGDLLLLPFTGDHEEKPVATFDKADEEVEVGYYAVSFNNFKVKAELSATTRVGLHRYTYHNQEKKRLLVDVGHILQRTWGHENVKNELEIIDHKTIRGLKYSSGWAYDHQVYFYAEFSSPFVVDEVIIDEQSVAAAERYEGQNVCGYFSFNELADQEALQIKVSISPVDAAGAQKNMEQELPGWDFDEVRANAEKAWRQALQKIKVSTDDTEKLTIFYTALYHSFIAPIIYQDVDGRYRGMDLKIHQAPPNSTNYTVFSMWDTFRALHPLMTIIDEPKAGSWVNNLLLKYQEGGILPMWPLAANYTGTMVGYPAVSVIADALSKDIPGIDRKLALEASINSASYKPELIEGTKNQRKKNVMPLYNKYVNEGKHIPADEIVKSVSFALEMAYYDWCIAQMAKWNGQDSLSRYFEQRAKNYRQYFDAETGFMRGKNADGSWVTPFNPKFSSHEFSAYVEGNAWQWNWFVPHDIEGFIDLYPNREAFIQKLDTLFRTSSEIEGEDASSDITGLIGQYAHGNEPSHHIAYLYTFAGQAWKTQELIDRILNDFYSTQRDGIIGNEDCGQMSAWYILNAMGFYQVCPGEPVYTIGRPLFERVEVQVGDGKIFIIQTENNSPDNKYVQEVFLNGEQLENLFFRHSDIKSGSTLKIVMGNTPK